jgi:hypothetical protein
VVKNKATLVAGVIILFFIVVFLFLKYRRESEKWVEDIKLLNGNTIKVFHHYSQRAMYGPLHFLIGGGGEKYVVCFEYRGTVYIWQCLDIPIVIQFWKNDLYMVMLDIENFSLQFRFYKYKKKLIEISSKDFPKSVAIQNRWISDGTGLLSSHKTFTKYKIDPNDDFFRYSVTAKIWLRLENGIDFRESRYQEVDKDFLIEYKKKYIDSCNKKT